MKLLTTLKKRKAGVCEGLSFEYQAIRWYYLIVFMWFFVLLSIRSISCGVTRDKSSILASQPFDKESISKAEESFRLYTSLFWRPKVYIKRNATDAFRKSYYHIQAAPDGIFSPLIRKNPALFQQIINKEASPGDFYNVPDTIGKGELNILWEKLVKIIKNGVEELENSIRVQTEFMQLLMESVFTLPRSVSQFPDNRDAVGGLIFGTLAVSGLMVRTESFQFSPISSTDKKTMNTKKERKSKLNGINIIGVIPGKNWNTKKDKPLVIGAHWDSYGASGGFNDNGASLAALLETARVLASARCFSPVHSILFVAFDAEEAGCAGSKEFISSYIRPLKMSKGIEIQGAIILDTIFNYDSEVSSQHFSKVWKNESPQTVFNVQKRGLKGDFLASVIRNDPKDRRLAKVFKRNYDAITKETARKDPLDSNDSFSQSRLFNLENVEISQINGLRFPSMEKMVQLSQLWMSDHSQFWYFLQNEIDYRSLEELRTKKEKISQENIDGITNTSMSSFGAMLLTDTGYLRGYMKSCYHKPCDNFMEARKNEHRYNDSLVFLTKTTQALLLTILDLTTNDFNYENNPIEKDNNATLDHSSVNQYQYKGQAPINIRREKAMIPEEQCGTERKEILSSLSKNEKFIPSLLIKTSEKKIVDRINNSDGKVSAAEFPAVTNDIEQYEKLDLNIKQNISLPFTTKNTKIYSDTIRKNIEHGPSRVLNNDYSKQSTPQNKYSLELQESASKDENFEVQIQSHNSTFNYKLQDAKQNMNTKGPHNPIDLSYLTHPMMKLLKKDIIGIAERFQNISSNNNEDKSPKVTTNDSFQHYPDHDLPVIEQLQPNFGGIQINIRNLHLDVSGDSKTKPYESNDYLDKNEDFSTDDNDYFFLLRNEKKVPRFASNKMKYLKTKLHQIAQKYYDNNNKYIKQKSNEYTPYGIRRQENSQNSPKNSPMLIKLLRNEEL